MRSRAETLRSSMPSIRRRSSSSEPTARLDLEQPPETQPLRDGRVEIIRAVDADRLEHLLPDPRRGVRDVRVRVPHRRAHRASASSRRRASRPPLRGRRAERRGAPPAGGRRRRRAPPRAAGARGQATAVREPGPWSRSAPPTASRMRLGIAGEAAERAAPSEVSNSPAWPTPPSSRRKRATSSACSTQRPVGHDLDRQRRGGQRGQERPDVAHVPVDHHEPAEAGGSTERQHVLGHRDQRRGAQRQRCAERQPVVGGAERQAGQEHRRHRRPLAGRGADRARGQRGRSP